MTEKVCCIIFQDTLTFIVNAQFNLLRIDYASLTIPRVAFSNLNLKKWPLVWSQLTAINCLLDPNKAVRNI